MRHLDLDDPKTWIKDFHNLIFEKTTWNYILKSKIESFSGGSILEMLSYKEEYINDQVVLNMVRKAKEILISRYKFAIGYHGCRVTNKDSYIKNGIIPSKPEQLITFTKKLFNLDIEVDDAVNEINKFGYLSHNEDKIGFLLSAKWAIYTKNQHPLGSELIRAIAGRLGKEYLKKYFDSGKSTLIKCKIPIDWLDVYTTHPMIKSYVSSILYQIIFEKFWPDDKEPRVLGGFMLKHIIPPEYIIEYIDTSGFNNEEAFINENK